MTTWEQANRRAGVMAGEWHAELGIDLSRPVDPFDTIRRLGIILAFGRLGPCRGRDGGCGGARIRHVGGLLSVGITDIV